MIELEIIPGKFLDRYALYYKKKDAYESVGDDYFPRCGITVIDSS